MIPVLVMAITLVAVPLRHGEVPSLPSPPALPARTARCKSISPAKPNSFASLSVGVYAFETMNVEVKGIFNGFLPNGGIDYPSQVLVYVRLDEQPAQYISIYPSGEMKGTDFLVAFSRVAEGSHVVDFGLVSRKGANGAFGRICFDVSKHKNTLYEFL